jgi:hypothetical protein
MNVEQVQQQNYTEDGNSEITEFAANMATG